MDRYRKKGTPYTGLIMEKKHVRNVEEKKRFEEQAKEFEDILAETRS